MILQCKLLSYTVPQSMHFDYRYSIVFNFKLPFFLTSCSLSCKAYYITIIARKPVLSVNWNYCNTPKYYYSNTDCEMVDTHNENTQSTKPHVVCHKHCTVLLYYKVKYLRLYCCFESFWNCLSLIFVIT